MGRGERGKRGETQEGGTKWGRDISLLMSPKADTHQRVIIHAVKTWGMGHGVWGMWHGAWGMQTFRGLANEPNPV